MIQLSRLLRTHTPMPIGFDLAHENLHMLQLEKNSRGELRVRAGITVPYPLPREELFRSAKQFHAFVHQALQQKPFKGKTIVSYLPGNLTRLLHLEYEAGPQLTADEAIAKGVVTRLGGQQDDFIIDYLQVRTEDMEAKKRSALVAVAPKKDVLAFLAVLTSAGLEVAHLEIGPAALRRLLASLDQEQRYPSLLLINFGRAKSFLTILSGRRLLMDREIDFGENKLVTAICKALAMKERQALEILYKYGLGTGGNLLAAMPDELKAIADTIREILKPIFFELTENINKALIFMASETRGQTVEGVYLLGSVARYPGADRFISDMFSLPVRVLYPLAHLPLASRDAIPRDLDPVVSIAMATGLALRGA